MQTRLSTRPSATRPTFPGALPIALPIALLLAAALAVPAAAGKGKKTPPAVALTSWSGSQTFKGSLKGLGKISDDEPAMISFDESLFEYRTESGATVEGGFRLDGRKIVLDIGAEALDELAGVIADLIGSTLALNGIDAGVVTVTIDPSKVKLKAKVKSSRKRGNTLLVTLALRFTARSSNPELGGSRKGKFKVKAVLPQAGPAS